MNYVKHRWAGIATGYGLVGRGILVPLSEGERDFLFSTVSGPGLRPTQPPNQWVPVALSLKVKETVALN
jgi:hypothetical protein